MKIHAKVATAIGVAFLTVGSMALSANANSASFESSLSATAVDQSSPTANRPCGDSYKYDKVASQHRSAHRYRQVAAGTAIGDRTVATLAQVRDVPPDPPDVPPPRCEPRDQVEATLTWEYIESNCRGPIGKPWTCTRYFWVHYTNAEWWHLVRKVKCTS